MKIPKERIVRFIILSAIGLTFGAGIAAISIWRDQTAESTALIATDIGGPFVLVDQNGRMRTERDYADKAKIIYFGFTSCPAICPTELQKIADAYKALPVPLQKKLQPIFITIDPERDTPKIIKYYVSLFLPNMVGLTGSVEQIAAVEDTFKVYAAKIMPDGDKSGDYTMDHSSFIYVTDEKNHVVAMYKTGDSATKIAGELQMMLGH